MKTPPLPEIDWDSLARRTLAASLSLFRKQGLYYPDNVLKGLGLSPEDLAQESLREFFTHRDRYEANTESQCLAIIVKIMRNDFLDAITKNHAYIKTEDIEEEALNEMTASLEAPKNGLSEFEANVLAEQFYPYAKGDQELKDVIAAGALLAVEQPGELKRDDIATFLNIPPGEITKRTNRLKYEFLKTSNIQSQ